MVKIGSKGRGTRAFTQQGRLEGLTGLRFCAAAWVFTYHFFVLAWQDAPWPLPLVQQSGHAAVSLFFVLSGFVLAYSYLDPLATGAVTPRRFWWRRFARVWPLYALTLLAEVPLLRRSGVAASTIALGTLIQLLGLQAWVPRFTAFGNTPGWSVSVELALYTLFPLLPLGRLTRLQHPLRPLATLFALALGLAALPALLPPTSPLALFVKCGPPLRLPEFLVGVLLGGAHRQGWPSRRIALVGLASGSPVLALAPHWPGYLTHALLLPSFAGLLVLVARNGALGRLLGRAWLVTLGEASYALYLLQMPLFAALGGGYEQPGGVLAGYFFLLLFVALVVHHGVERPLQRWLNRRF